MKLAIFLDDGLLQEADRTARLMGLSRRRLFALAMSDFLKEQMLLRLNEVYGSGLKPGEKLLLKGIKAKVRATVKKRSTGALLQRA